MSNLDRTLHGLHAGIMLDRLATLKRTLVRLTNCVDSAERKVRAEPTDCSEYYSNIAQELAHEVTWGLANASIHYLAQRAAQADIARAGESG